MQDNNITTLLGLDASEIVVTRVNVLNRSSGNIKEIYLERILRPQYCPECGFRMYSHGTYTRTVNHPILQDGFALKLLVKQRTWRCTNPGCNNRITDHFSFLDKYRRNTNVTDLLIVESFRDFLRPVAQIARQYNVSDTYAFETFDRYVDMPRRPLTQIVSVDEVYLNLSSKNKYALILQDFITGEPLDMLINRRSEVTTPYFANLPAKEKAGVRYLITDMYRPYIAYVEKYFPNAVSVIDAFHVIQAINRPILQYIRDLQNRYHKRDLKRHEELEQSLGRHVEFTPSWEYFLLKKYRWLILKNQDDIKYSKPPRYVPKFRCYMDYYAIERKLFSIDPTLKVLRDLKEKYIRFNKRYEGDPVSARPAFEKLIQEYSECQFLIFHDIANTLREFKEPILRSFILVERLKKEGSFKSRLSNGPIESLNRIPKDMKRMARGYHNFAHVRNRFLFSQRKNAAILGVPKTREEIRIIREPYKDI